MVAKDYKQKTDGFEEEDGRVSGGHVQELIPKYTWKEIVRKKAVEAEDSMRKSLDAAHYTISSLLYLSLKKRQDMRSFPFPVRFIQNYRRQISKPTVLIENRRGRAAIAC